MSAFDAVSLPSSSSFEARVADLAQRFQSQVGFAQDYSPLYARLFGLFADWLAAPDRAQDPLVNWLVAAGSGRQPFSVPLLLLAGLHRLVLSDSADELSQYYATVEGSRSFDDSSFSTHVRNTLLQNQAELARFIQTTAVQTNETGRGLAWLLPILYTNWQEVQLVDLGASAGLNLLADYRAYRLVSDDGRILLDVGAGGPAQFQTLCRDTPAQIPAGGRLPRILRRLGCDLAPFQLAGPEDELTLMSFVWGDQPERLQRLREGIAAYHLAQDSDTPVQLVPASLPGDLQGFLYYLSHRAPLVLYNTILTFYLADKGSSLRDIIGAWAVRRDQPILWLQWEPAWGAAAAPANGWCAWTADLWQAGSHYHWRLGWIHPHGVEVQFEQGLADWIRYWA